MNIAEVTDGLVEQATQFLSSRKEFEFQQNWDSLFKYRWKLEQFPYGYAILERGTMLGFLATMFAEREIAGEHRIVCNLSNWVVDEGSKLARSLAAALILAPMKKKVLLTCQTANETAQRVFLKLGFQSLDTQQIAVPLVGGPGGWFGRGSVQAILDPAEMSQYLSGSDKRIFSDHQNQPCGHFLIRDRDTGQYCYGITTTNLYQSRILTNWNCLNVCYLSDTEFFCKKFQFVRSSLRKRWHAITLRYDARLIPQQLSRWEYKLPTVRFTFAANDIAGKDIDNLYSELVTFNKY